MKSILITGSSGFIGGHLKTYLKKLNYNLILLDKDYPISQNNEYAINICDIHSLIKLIQVNNYDIDCIIHLAAIGSVPRSFQDPQYVFQNNVNGFLNILEIIKRYKIPKLIYASSSSVFGDSKSILKTEGEEGKPLSPYALTKKINEDLAELYASKCNLKAIGLRFFNVYGPDQKVDHTYGAVIPRFIDNIIKDQTSDIFGDGNQTRDFTFVGDVVLAIAQVLQHLNYKNINHGVYNIGCGKVTSVSTIYGIIAKQLNKTYLSRFNCGLNRLGDIQHSTADISKFSKEFVWNPIYSLDNGLNITVRSYLKDSI